MGTYNTIFSDSSVYGEGEHKIMEDIRTTGNKDDVYVIYGLDSDLFFLAMANPRLNLYLLRESAQLGKFGNRQRKPAVDLEFDPVEDVAEELEYISIDNLSNLK